jgi:hypothetical protein
MMVRVLAAVMLLASSPVIAGEITLPSDDEVTIGCQLKVVAGYKMPFALMARDETTGAILFSMSAGEELSVGNCIKAPPGHRLIVSGDGVPPETK